MATITEMFAFVAQEADGEGVAAVQLGGMMMPLIGADAARVASLRKMAQQVADGSNMPLTLVRFSLREELEVIVPQGYRLVEGGGAIMCMTCGRVSHSAGDVLEKYCGNCKKFHGAP